MLKQWIVVLLFSLHLLQSMSLNKDAANQKKKPATRRTKVLILGAGVAGITAAKTLQQNGVHDFLILEAQDYIGGRFKQRSFAGVKLEEGANWIHFAKDKDNTLWELKQKYQLRGIFTNYSDIVIRYMLPVSLKILNCVALHLNSTNHEIHCCITCTAYYLIF